MRSMQIVKIEKGSKERNIVRGTWSSETTEESVFGSGRSIISSIRRKMALFRHFAGIV